jgi:hypothetical protein
MIHFRSHFFILRLQLLPVRSVGVDASKVRAVERAMMRVDETMKIGRTNVNWQNKCQLAEQMSAGRTNVNNHRVIGDVDLEALVLGSRVRCGVQFQQSKGLDLLPPNSESLCKYRD